MLRAPRPPSRIQASAQSPQSVAQSRRPRLSHWSQARGEIRSVVGAGTRGPDPSVPEFPLARRAASNTAAARRHFPPRAVQTISETYTASSRAPVHEKTAAMRLRGHEARSRQPAVYHLSLKEKFAKGLCIWLRRFRFLRRSRDALLPNCRERFHSVAAARIPRSSIAGS
jgi:hypothetical protein